MLFLSPMVKTFMQFPPLGVVLVAILGVGIAEHSGFLSAGLKGLLNFTPGKLCANGDAGSHLEPFGRQSGYVVVIPLAGVMFFAAGRHPLAGIAAGFAAVSGGLSATYAVPPGPFLQGFTHSAAQTIDPGARLIRCATGGSPALRAYF